MIKALVAAFPSSPLKRHKTSCTCAAHNVLAATSNRHVACFLLLMMSPSVVPEHDFELGQALYAVHEIGEGETGHGKKFGSGV
jgi:hypothetical protein